MLKEVIERGLCGKCGGCVSFCTADELQALEIGDDDVPRYANEDKCLKCGICYTICPQTRILDEDLQARFGWRPPIGSYRTIVSARTTDKGVMEVCTDGGVVTSLLLYLLENNLVEGIVVSRKIGPFAREPMIATNREDLILAAGSQFTGAPHLEELGGKYTTYSPILQTIKVLVLSLKGVIYLTCSSRIINHPPFP